MRISGNQTAIRELFQLLDPSLKDPFKCYGYPCGCQHDGKTNILSCKYRNKDFENLYGCDFYDYEFSYDGDKISNLKLLHHGYPNSNILNGTVR